MKDINEFLGLGNKKSTQRKICDTIPNNTWNELHMHGQTAIEIMCDAIDYIVDNYDKFGKYEKTENVIRDAINNTLDEYGFSHFLKIE